MKDLIKSIQISDVAEAEEILKSAGSEDLFEKARQVGEAHPNGKWVWTEYAPGKFDWRGIKKKDGGSGKTAKPTTNKQDSGFKGSSFKEEVRYKKSDWEAWKNSALKDFEVEELDKNLFGVYLGNKHVGTYDLKREVLMCNDTKLFGNSVKQDDSKTTDNAKPATNKQDNSNNDVKGVHAMTNTQLFKKYKIPEVIIETIYTKKGRELDREGFKSTENKRFASQLKDAIDRYGSPIKVEKRKVDTYDAQAMRNSARQQIEYEYVKGTVVDVTFKDSNNKTHVVSSGYSLDW